LAEVAWGKRRAKREVDVGYFLYETKGARQYGSYLKASRAKANPEGVWGEKKKGVFLYSHENRGNGMNSRRIFKSQQRESLS